MGETFFLLLGVACLLLFFIGKKKRGKFYEVISFWWLRLAVSVLLLYLVHLIGMYFSIFVAINMFAIACVLLLRLPGLVVVIVASVVNFF